MHLIDKLERDLKLCDSLSVESQKRLEKYEVTLNNILHENNLSKIKNTELQRLVKKYNKKIRKLKSINAPFQVASVVLSVVLIILLL